MNQKDFIKSKIELLAKDDQKTFNDMSSALDTMAEKGMRQNTVKLPTDGNFFKISFDAVKIKEDRLVITASRSQDGMYSNRYNPAEKEYRVEFDGTRAAYLIGLYNPSHRLGRWPYISWEVRAYANNPANANQRVYVRGFHASKEIKRMLRAMGEYYNTNNVCNSYINDNQLRFKTGMQINKTPEQIEREWSKGLMESLGYQYVEARDSGHPKGQWNGVESHWFKLERDRIFNDG